MKEKTIQDEFRQTITPPSKGGKERAKAATIQPTVYAHHAEGKSISNSKSVFQVEKAGRFPLWSLCSPRTGKGKTAKRPKVHSPKMKDF